MPPPGLERFRKAQADPHVGYEVALAELRAGRKRGHWIWHIFPQLSGLGGSEASRVYGIGSIAEASDYIRDPVLGSRLLTITSAVADHLRRGASLTVLMGSEIDAVKLVSSLTLFDYVARGLAASDGGETYRTLADAAEEVLAIAELQGYSRCQYTLQRLAH